MTTAASISLAEPSIIIPDWPAPPSVVACVTTRRSLAGVSLGAYGQFNLAQHVEDDLDAVTENRKQLRAGLALPTEPHWLNQTHGDHCLELPSLNIDADASYTTALSQVCAVLTADCLPLLVCDQAGTTVAAIHAGWRGLANHIIPKCLSRFNIEPKNLLVWLGPAISAAHYTVGDEVKTTFLQINPAFNSAFESLAESSHALDLYQIARLQLEDFGVHQIFGGERCTYAEKTLFYSYRREGITGRQASLIWLKAT